MKKYNVLVVGLGKRGKHHATHFYNNPRFKLAGICNISGTSANSFSDAVGSPPVGNNPAEMAHSLKPDLFCFSSLPAMRSEMVSLGIDCGAKLIAMEKPIALTSLEGFKVKNLINKSNIKCVVSHQHRYGDHFQAVKKLISEGTIGKVHTVYGYAQGWPAQLLSHVLDYSMWFNNYEKPVWVTAQGAGKTKLSDPTNHFSPDYISGTVHFENGVHGTYECGGGSPDVPEVERFWGKNRIGAIGSQGYAEIYSENGYKAVTPNGILTGNGCINYEHDMQAYIDQMADWLHNDQKVHECCFENAWQGFEISMGMYRSIIDTGQITLPLDEPRDEIEELKQTLSSMPLQVTLEESQKEYKGLWK